MVPAPDSCALVDSELVVLGRIMPASNHTFLARLGESEVQCVYKPTSGERPLWDFTDGTLAEREYAAWLVSDHLGWDVVPPTVLRDGPVGWGMVQLWMDTEELSGLGHAQVLTGHHCHFPIGPDRFAVNI